MHLRHGVPVDLDSYLARIGYAGDRTPTLDALRRVVLAHACAVPLENLDVLLGRGVSLSDADVERKLVHDRRGGYCFEQNSLLLRALSAMGFAATPLSARVRLKAPREFVPPRTHLFLRVDIEGIPWLADIGIGSLSPTATLRLDLFDLEQPTPHEPRRIVREERVPFPRYFHPARLGDDWADVNEFTLQEMPPIDRELGNWWTSTSPNSKFRQNLLVALARPDGTRLSVLNREFTHRRGADVLERLELADNDHVLAVLGERFGLWLPAGTQVPIPTGPTAALR
ncbi:MAG: arylamine N-acetyltransferase [Gemmataceae bacterium]|nr:arylamine N-acetyltransferase [Gemmataceae bacterium]